MIGSRLPFEDRHAAGRELAGALAAIAPEWVGPPVVVALPRGGVPVGFEVARALGAPLDIALVRKLGAPQQPELGMGAIGEGGTIKLDRETVDAVGVSREQLDRIAEREEAELRRQAELYRGDRQPVDLTGRTVILVDDGLATGVSAVTAGRHLRERGAGEVMAAFPVCPPGSEERVGGEFDRLLCLESPPDFLGVGGFYRDFSQTSDDEVVALLRQAWHETPPS